MQRLQEIIDRAKAIVFFGGAGVSTESGIPDFRSADGLYNQKYDYPPEEILSRAFFNTRRAEFYRFYRDRVLALHARPNAAHLKLAELESAGKLKAVITQNIDGLHQAAGSRNVIELHGSVHRNQCVMCGRRFDAEVIKSAPGVPACPCGGAVKPDVVLYGESLDQEVIDRAIGAIRSADALIIGGTSLAVYPAAGLLDYFRGGQLVVINRTPLGSQQADLFIQGSIGEVLSGVEVLSAESAQAFQGA
jgi:NAD-dependent deacetylase